MNEVPEMEINMDEILLEFEEINSTIDKYLNNIESDVDDDDELVPRQKKCTATVPNHRDPILRESNFPRNQMVSTILVQYQYLEHSKTTSISCLLKKSPTDVLSSPTKTPCGKLKE